MSGQEGSREKEKQVQRAWGMSIYGPLRTTKEASMTGAESTGESVAGKIDARSWRTL